MTVIHETDTSENEVNPFRSELEPEVQSVGVVAVIYNTTTERFLTIKEKSGKPSTEKAPGQISFAAETRKVGESENENIWGALAEYGSDRDSEFFKQLTCCGYYTQAFFLKHDRGLPVDIVVFAYAGEEVPVEPACPDEVSYHGWMSREDFLQLRSEDPSAIRSVALQTMDFLLERDILTSPILFSRAPIAAEWSISGFNALRDTRPDVSTILPTFASRVTTSLQQNRKA